ncbi:MAG: NADH-ubiquinone oxidoreductase-F iron-sulfur binding region domain-containing protein [Solirubrobacteraceae bacterium]
MTDLESHVDVHGRLPDLRQRAPRQIIDDVRQSGLRGHGGASFPVARKLEAVASRRGPRVVVVNGTEGEPASKKDRVLLRELPHLVIDGAVVAAHAIGAREAIIAVPQGHGRTAESLRLAVGQRSKTGRRGELRFELVGVPERYLAGQESALVNLLSGGPARPTFGARPFEHGVRQRPTLVQNVETLAHLALIARHGPTWFRQLGTAEDPGSALVTVSGAVAHPGVYEIEHGWPLSDLLDSARVTDDLSAVLIGGYSGSWLPAAQIPRVLLSPRHLAEHAASLGAGVIVALEASVCPVAETARIADYFAAQGAGQCGPCVSGLGAIADTVVRLASGIAPATAHRDLERWASDLPGRGACQHPDGAARFIASALRVFADDFHHHAQRGRCARCSHPPVLSIPRPNPLTSRR